MRLRMAVLAVCLSLSMQVSADITWTLTDVQFADGGVATGWFLYRTLPEQTIVDWNISVSGGDTTKHPPTTWTPADSRFEFQPANAFPPERDRVEFIKQIGAGFRTFHFWVGGVFSQQTGTLPIQIHFYSGDYNNGPTRLITGGSLVAGPGPGGTQPFEVWLPISGSVVGGNGEFFRTNARIFNPSATAVTAKVWFLPTGSDNLSATPVEFSIPGRSMLELDDAVGQIGGSGLGALRVGSSSELRLTGQVFTDSKCTSPVAGGLYGQFVGGTRYETAFKRGVILHLRADGQARSNIGFANTAVTSAAVTIRAYGENDQQVGNTVIVDVPPFGATTPLNLESLVGTIADESVWVAFESTQPVIGYGSVVDWLTSDQYYSPAIADPAQ